MIRFWIMAASLAMTTSVRGAVPPRGIEADYPGWQSVKVDPTRGVAYFVTPPQRAGDAVHFAMLIVYRDLHRPPDIGMRGVELDKEIFSFLGDCGSRAMLRTGYRYQNGNEPVALTMSPVQTATVPSKESPEALSLEAACRVPQDPYIIVPAGFMREPYAWAKERLRQAP